MDQAIGSKVFWSEMEKAKVVARAADTQAERPDLAGLPLLRAAMMALPPSRRRKLVAVTQAPWFEPALAAEIRRRAIEAASNEPIVKMAKESGVIIELNYQMMLQWKAETAEWRSKVIALQDQTIGLFTQILIEFRALNAHLAASQPKKKR